MNSSFQAPAEPERPLEARQLTSARVIFRRLSACLAWLSFLFGVCAFWSLLAGYESSLVLPNTPRNVGPGFSEAATAAIGGALVGWWLAAAGFLAACVGIAIGPRRAFKLLLGGPAIIYFLSPVFFVR